MVRTNLPWKVAFLSLFLFCLLLAFTKGMGVHHDFDAFHRVGSRMWAGDSIYHSEDLTPFKYSPLSALLLSPLSLFSYTAAKMIYLVVLAISAALAPLVALWLGCGRSLSLGSTESPCKPRPSHITVSLAKAIGVGVLASLRFLDNEFHSVQVNALSLVLMLAGCACWLLGSGRKKKALPFAGALLYGAGALFKLHPLFGLGVFVKRKAFRTLLVLSGVILFLAILPSPSYWTGYPRHMRITNQLIDVSHSMIVQGFYPFCASYFGTGRTPFLPVVLFSMIAIPVLVLIPKFDLFDTAHLPSRSPSAFMLSIGALLLTAVTISPLPWQHTYLPLWAFVPLAFTVGTRAEKRIWILLSAVMGLTARGIVGRPLADFLELHQLIFFVSLLMVFLLLFQARRLMAENVH